MKSLRDYLREIVSDNTTRKGRIFDYCIQALILISLVSFSIDTLPNLDSQTQKILDLIELVSIIIFSTEYFLRIFVAKRPFKYIFSFYGLIDLLAILPFYIRTALDLRVLRTFRVFRIFRSLKLIRYNRALERFHIATRVIKEEIVLFSVMTGVLLFISASGIYYFENEAQPALFQSIFHSLWWAIVTLTTVGYGDVYPITVGGRIFTFFVLLIGIGVVTVPAGLFASALSKAREMQDKEPKHL